MNTSLFCSYLTSFKWLQNNLLPCLFKKFTGIDCPLCGLQRSLLALFQGDFADSLRFHPATIPLLLSMALTLPVSGLQTTKTLLLKKTVYAVTIILITGAYLFKLQRQLF